MTVKDKLGIICILIVVTLFIGCLNTNPSSSTIPSQKSLSVEEIKRTAIDISYDELMRNTENHKGEIIVFKGKILQVIEDENGNDKFDFRIGTRIEKNIHYDKYARDTYYTFDYSPEDVIYVGYKGKRMLEGDIVAVWGRVDGRMKYKAVLGNIITIPEVEALNLELIQKTGEQQQ